MAGADLWACWVWLRSRDADLQVALDGGAKLGCGHGAQVATAYGPVGADEQRGRQGGDAKPGASLPLGVGRQRVGHPGLGDEPPGGGLHVEVVQAKEADPVLGLEVD